MVRIRYIACSVAVLTLGLLWVQSASAIDWKGFYAQKTGAHSSLLTVKFEDTSKIGVPPDQLYLSGNLGKNLKLQKQSIKTRQFCNGRFNALGSCYTYTYSFRNIKHGATWRGAIYHVMKGHWPHFLFPDEINKHYFSLKL